MGLISLYPLLHFVSRITWKDKVEEPGEEADVKYSLWKYEIRSEYMLTTHIFWIPYFQLY